MLMCDTLALSPPSWMDGPAAESVVNARAAGVVPPRGGGDANSDVIPAPEMIPVAESVVNAPVLGVVAPIAPLNVLFNVLPAKVPANVPPPIRAAVPLPVSVVNAPGDGGMDPICGGAANNALMPAPDNGPLKVAAPVTVTCAKPSAPAEIESARIRANFSIIMIHLIVPDRSRETHRLTARQRAFQPRSAGKCSDLPLADSNTTALEIVNATSPSRPHAEWRRPGSPQRGGEVGEITQQAAGVARADDLVDPERLGGARTGSAAGSAFPRSPPASPEGRAGVDFRAVGGFDATLQRQGTPTRRGPRVAQAQSADR